MSQSQTTAQKTPYDLFGGDKRIWHLAARLYEIMETDPAAARIRAMHKEDLSVVAGHLAGYLAGWMGGPRDYFEDASRPCIMSAHKPFDIGPEDRDAWMTCFRKALAEETDLDPKFRDAFEKAIAHLADGLRQR